MKTKCLALLALLVILSLTTGTLVAQDQAVYVTGLYLDTSDEIYVCYVFELQIDGMKGKDVRIFAYPEYEDESPIPNYSLDPDFTDADGYLFNTLLIENIRFDSALWGFDGGGVKMCLNSGHFPLDEDDYNYALNLFFLDENTGDPIGVYNSLDDGLAFTRLGTPQAIRVTNVNYDFEARVNGSDGIIVDFTLEAYGYEGDKLRVAVYPVNDNGNFIESRVNNSDFTASDGSITSQYVVTPKWEYTYWNGDSSFKLFIPYSHFPRPNGEYNWYPLFNVFDERTNTVLYAQTFWDDGVTMS